MRRRRAVLSGVATSILAGCIDQNQSDAEATTMESEDYETTMGSKEAAEYDQRISTLSDLAIANGVPREVVIGRLLVQARQVDEMDEEWAGILKDGDPSIAVRAHWWTQNDLYEHLTGPYNPDKHRPKIDDPELKERVEDHLNSTDTKEETDR